MKVAGKTEKAERENNGGGKKEWRANRHLMDFIEGGGK